MDINWDFITFCLSFSDDDTERIKQTIHTVLMYQFYTNNSHNINVPISHLYFFVVVFIYL